LERHTFRADTFEAGDSRSSDTSRPSAGKANGSGRATQLLTSGLRNKLSHRSVQHAARFKRAVLFLARPLHYFGSVSSLPHHLGPPLSLDTAGAAIHACFPTIRTDGVRHLGSGWDFDAFLTTDGWVFRFPRRAECATTLDTERRLHDVVAAVLPPSVAVPKTELMGQPGPAFPCRFAGYRFIPGVAADTVPPSLLSITAGSIGQALGAIHGVPEAEARAAGVREMPADEPGRQRWLDDRLRAAGALRGIDSVVGRAVDWLEGNVRRRPPAYPGPPHLTHDDLSPEHLLVDPETGALAGILDWSDAALGDPARDFAPLVAWHGWAFADEVLRSYPHRIDDGFRDRLRFTARALSVLWLAEAREWTPDAVDDVAKHVRWVHNVFAMSAAGAG
jgi:aminoglycoside phosphotransferase (APT) family kinase protein